MSVRKHIEIGITKAENARFYKRLGEMKEFRAPPRRL